MTQALSSVMSVIASERLRLKDFSANCCAPSHLQFALPV
uniref:Transcriptional regulator n=1 Tax=Ascaris lumbricoides TaxID=6252 RepID=A0A0M3IE94_ASCLU